MRKIYKNALIDGTVTDITVEGGKFLSLKKTSEDGLDLCGKKVYAGLIDVHTHGCMGADTMDGEFENMPSYYAKEGRYDVTPSFA